MSDSTYHIWSIILWALALSAGCITVFIYGKQLKAMNRSIDAQKEASERQIAAQKLSNDTTLRAQNLAWLIQHLQAPEVRHARFIVINELSKKASFHLWNDAEREEAATACAGYGTAAVFLKLNRVDKDVLMENWGPSIALVTHICEEFIEDRRAANGPQYWNALDWLSKEVSIWLDKEAKTIREAN